jgi:hypothetical protein
VLTILLDERQDTCRNNAVGFAKVVVDLWDPSVLQPRRATVLFEPCKVRVMDCSSFSSSSVSVRFLGAEGPGRDILASLGVYQFLGSQQMWC